MSTGNLDAKYVIIGDAPGQGDGKERYFDRVMVYGPTSHLLRRALLRSSIYFDSWIMNLMRCSFPSNRKGKRSEYDRCFQYVESEILLLENVTTVFLLGRHVKDYFEQRFGIRLSFYKDRDRVRQIQLGHRELRVAAVYHPSYFLRSGLGVDQCTESFERVLQLTKGSY